MTAPEPVPPPVDLTALAAGATEATDPIVPESESPFTEAEAAERQSFLDRALGTPRTQRTRKRRGKPLNDTPGAPKAIPPKPRPGALARPLTEMYVALGMSVMVFDQPCGTAIVNSGPRCADALENLARENPAVRRALLALVETSVWGQVIVAHAPIMAAIAVHHIPGAGEKVATVAGKVAAQQADDFLRNQNGQAPA